MIRRAPKGARAGLCDVFDGFPTASKFEHGLRYTFMSPAWAVPGSADDIIIHRDGLIDPLCAGNTDDAVFAIEKDVTVQLQYRRRELCFIHAAVIARGGRAYVLAAESGSGKSTTCWALLHSGFEFLSDELAPVALDGLVVHPCPFALVLKRPPPDSHPLPSGISRHGRIRIPTRRLPGRVAAGPLPLAGVFFVEHDAARTAPSIRAMRPAEAAARLYVSTLNALAHGHQGVDAVTQIVSNVPCYALDTAELGTTCRLFHAHVSQERN